MTLQELKASIEAKTLAFEALLENQQPQSHLRQLYKELKELKYQLVQAELHASVQKSALPEQEQA